MQVVFIYRCDCICPFQRKTDEPEEIEAAKKAKVEEDSTTTVNGAAEMNGSAAEVNGTDKMVLYHDFSSVCFNKTNTICSTLFHCF